MNNIYYCYFESDKTTTTTPYKTDLFSGKTQQEARDWVEKELNEARRELFSYVCAGRNLKSGIGFHLGQRKISKATQLIRLYCDHFRTSYFHKPNPERGVWVDYEYQPLLTPEEVDGLLTHHPIQPINPSFWTEKEAARVSDLELMLEIRKSLYAHKSLVELGFLEARSLHAATDLSIYAELMKRVSN